MAHGWARTISLERHRTEEVRQTYLRLNFDMDQIPTRYGTTIHEPQHVHATPSIMVPRGNGDSNSRVIEMIRALDGILSELSVLEIKYMLQSDSSDGPAIKIPFLLRLKFRIKGKRELRATLGELRRHNEVLKATTKDLRKAVQYSLAISAHRMNSMNAEIHPAAGQIVPSQQADGGFSTLSIVDLIDLSPSISPDVWDADAVLFDDTPRIPPPLASKSTSSAASSRVDMSLGVFESSTSFISYEREDNYSVNKLRGDKICTQCHQMCRGAGYS